MSLCTARNRLVSPISFPLSFSSTNSSDDGRIIQSKWSVWLCLVCFCCVLKLSSTSSISVTVADHWPSLQKLWLLLLLLLLRPLSLPSFKFASFKSCVCVCEFGVCTTQGNLWTLFLLLDRHLLLGKSFLPTEKKFHVNLEVPVSAAGVMKKVSGDECDENIVVAILEEHFRKEGFTLDFISEIEERKKKKLLQKRSALRRMHSRCRRQVVIRKWKWRKGEKLLNGS